MTNDLPPFPEFKNISVVLYEARSTWDQRTRIYDELRDMLHSYALAAIKEGRERAERAEQDAKRYRWMLERGPEEFLSDCGITKAWYFDTKEQYDAAIDAAIAQEQPK